MRICQVELRGFRGVRHGTVKFPRHCVLLGANNAGKSTIIGALNLLFGQERMSRPICDWDFYGGNPKPDTRFYIIATITDFPDNNPANVPEWFVGEQAARPVWWNDDSASVSVEADPPSGTTLATQVALCGRYDDELCEFETVRYFWYGEGDPFSDGCSPVPGRLLRELGVFVLPSNREWDRILSFGSSSLMKVMREYDAVPGKAVNQLKRELRDEVTKVEEVAPLADILRKAMRELKSFLLVGQSSNLVYRPTSLDTLSVLQSLVAHVTMEDGSLIPISRHGAGTVSLQAFLLLLAFGEHRRAANRDFILLAEEPELHLHPSLHQRLVNRMRSVSTQSIVTTHSPEVASGYQPNEVVFIRNENGQMSAEFLRREPIKQIKADAVRDLYLARRGNLYGALMGGVILVPEGLLDHDWLSLWQRLAQAASGAAGQFDLRPVAVVPTGSASVVQTYREISRLREDAIPIVDGDDKGNEYIHGLAEGTPCPRKVIRYGKGAGVECLSAWILEPALSKPGAALSKLLGDSSCWELRDLQKALIASKDDRELHERLVWESLSSQDCCARACEFFHDVSAIASNSRMMNPGWTVETLASGCQVFTATHIRRA